MDVLYHLKEIFVFLKLFFLKQEWMLNLFSAFLFSVRMILFFFLYLINIVNYISKECTLRNTCILGRNPPRSWNMSTIGFCLLVFYLDFLHGYQQVKERIVCIFFCVVFIIFSFIKIQRSFLLSFCFWRIFSHLGYFFLLPA